ncbi:MAG: RNA polymerase sigma factor [Thermodesulfobacteriota bacterium]
MTPFMPILFKAAWRLTGRSDEAEDLVQQVLVKLYPKTEEMQAIEHLGPWLKKVLYREFVDGWRKKSRRPEHYLSDSRNDVSALQAEEDNPETLAERASDHQRVREALDALKGSDRTLIIMHLIEGYTVGEMQEFFHAPAETIKTRLRRARNHLKKFLMQ